MDAVHVNTVPDRATRSNFIVTSMSLTTAFVKLAYARAGLLGADPPDCPPDSITVGVVV